MDHLDKYLNKYLKQIIIDYAIFDVKKLVSYNPKQRTQCIRQINPDLTIEDLIIKSHQRGYKGICIKLEEIDCIKYLNQISNKRIGISVNNIYKVYGFIEDERDLFYFDLWDLNDVWIIHERITNN